MKIVHKNLDVPIDFTINNAWSLVIENSREYLNFCVNLFRQCNGAEGQFVLSENFDIIDFKKYAIFIYDYFDTTVNDKKIVANICDTVLQTLKKNDYLEEFSKLQTSYLELNEKLLQDIDLNISYEDNLSYESFVKLSQYKIIQEDDLVLRLITYVDLMAKIKGIKLVIFQNLYLYLNLEQLESLIKQLKYMQLNILFINPFAKYNLKNVQQIIIDEDLCVI